LKSAVFLSTLCTVAIFAGSPGAQAWAETPATDAGFSRLPDEQSLSELQLLGKRLFEDATLSEPQGMSCASCHDPKRAFQGNNGAKIAAVALGSRPDQFGVRKVPTIMYKAYSPPFGFYKDEDDGKVKLEPRGGQFWDGRANLLFDQATGPLLNPVEMNNPSAEAVVAKIQGGPSAALAKKVYGADFFADKAATMTNLAKAIAAYETTERFMPFSSKFDDWLRGKARLTAQEKRGFDIFTDEKKSNCSDCHAGKKGSKDPSDWVFSDFSYSVLGVPRNNAIPANADPKFFDLGLCKRPGLDKVLPPGMKAESYCGAFKAPTLRNVAVTGPYFHNGTFTTLRDAVAFYATRDTDPGRWYPKGADGSVEKFNDLPPEYRANVDLEKVPYDRKPGQKPHLSDKDIDAIVAFLNTLTDKAAIENTAFEHPAK
jgi:cytochrome c peroxidase